MTQVELARLMKVTPQTVNKIMHSSNVQTGALENICEALHLPISFFYEGNLPQQGGTEPTGYAEVRKGTAEYKPTIKETAEDVKDSVKVFDDSVTKIWETSHLSDKVRGLLKSQHKKFSVLYRHIGMTDAGLRRAFDRDSCNIKVLLKMAEFFNVPVTYFLPEDRRAKQETEKDREIQYLKGQLKAYENTLATVLQGMKGAENVELFAIHSAGE